MSAATGARPLVIEGRAPAFPDAVAWLEGLRLVADAGGHGEAWRYAGQLLAVVAAAHDTIDAGFTTDPALAAALLGVPRP